MRIVRSVAVLRRISVLLPGLIVLIAGQLVGFKISYLGLLGTLVLFALTRGLKCALALAALFVLGVFTANPGSSDVKIPELQADTAYVAKIVERPRRRKVGEVEVSLQLISKLNVKGTAFTPIKTLNVLCRTIELPWRNIHKAEKGESYVIRGKFTALNPDSIFSYEATQRRAGYTHSCKIKYAHQIGSAQRSIVQRFRDSIISAVQSKLGDGEKSALLLSMALGVRDLSSDQTERAFKQSGLAHLLVVSGFQVTLVFVSTVWFARRVLYLFPRLLLITNVELIGALLGAAVTSLFVALVGLEGATLRAAIAAVISAAVILLERGRLQLHSIIASLFLVSVLAPGCYLDPGMELSYAALFGLVLGNREGLGKVKRYLLSTSLATAFTGVVTLLRFGQFSFWGILLNPIFAPLLSFVSCYGGISALLLYYLGIDPDGYLIQQIAGLLLYFTHCLKRLLSSADLVIEI